MNGDTIWLEPKFEILPNTDQETILANIRANSLAHRSYGMIPHYALVVGGGPSAADHLDDLRRNLTHGDNADIWALNNAAAWLKEKGVTADYCVLYDARPQMVEMVQEKPRRFGSDGVSISEAAPHYYVSSQCHPAVFAALKDRGHKFTLFHALNGEGSMETIREVDPGALVLGNACSVGIQVLNLLAALGYHKATLYGYDSSWRKGAKHAYQQPGGLNDDQKGRQFMFKGMTYETSGAMAMQAEEFMRNLPQWRGAGLSIEVKGDGLLPDMWRAETSVSLEDREARKYAKMWDHKEYRHFSPGEDLKFDVLDWLPFAKAGVRVVDFGCGSGRLTQGLQDMGYRVLGVDFAANCMDDHVQIPFALANLWDLPETVTGTHGVCCDVMEHVPPAKVDAVLAGIRKAVPVCFFNIATTPDSFGAVIGEQLHLSVHDEKWWREQLKKHWSIITITRRSAVNFSATCS